MGELKKFLLIAACIKNMYKNICTVLDEIEQYQEVNESVCQNQFVKNMTDAMFS